MSDPHFTTYTDKWYANVHRGSTGISQKCIMQTSSHMLTSKFKTDCTKQLHHGRVYKFCNQHSDWHSSVIYRYHGYTALALLTEEREPQCKNTFVFAGILLSWTSSTYIQISNTLTDTFRKCLKVVWMSPPSLPAFVHLDREKSQIFHAFLLHSCTALCSSTQHFSGRLSQGNWYLVSCGWLIFCGL